MKWRVPRIWEGGDVWILGGGPSVTKQFNIPDDVVQSVVNGTSSPSVYSPYMSVLHDKHVIGVNVAYLIGEWIDMVYFGDNKFFLNHKERLSQWPGLKVSCFSGIEKYDWVKYLPRDTRKVRGISSDPRTVAWNCNSGASAISVAANAGAKRILLLGFDMNKGEVNRQHWHSLYKSKSVFKPVLIKGKGMIVRPHKMPFDRHLRGFPDIARDAKLRGIEIINVCPTSAITVFPKFSLKELLWDNS